MAVEHGDIKVDEGIFSVTLVFEDKMIQLDTEDVIDLYFIEDIFKFALTGKIVFYDKYNFLELGPFTGNEQILVTYGKEHETTIIFDIWKVNEISMTLSLDSQSFGMIELFFVDPSFQQIAFRKYSKSWAENTEIDEIIISILDNMTTLTKESTLEYEPSNYKMTNGFVMPYWSPQQALTFLMKRAVGSKSKNSSYLCYNNTQYNKMTTNLYTLDYLLNDEGNFADKDIYVFSDRDISNQNKILEWTISGTDKMSHEYIRGGKFKGYDWNSKSLTNTEMKYSDGVRKMTMLGKKTLFPDISDTFSTSINIGEDEETIKNVFYSEWSQRYVMQNVIKATVYGHEKRFAGQLIEIQWPSSVETGSDNSSFQGFNLSYKGTYLIKSVTHSFIGSQSQQEPYLQKIVLIKNGYSEVDTSNLYDSNNVKNTISKQSIVRV